MKWTPKVGQKTFGIHFMIVILAIWSVLRTEKLNKINFYTNFVQFLGRKAD